ncbi:hypothetical protein BC826DRAFT_1111891 [Russula brevipes]|nr:hypothetical protein BC826DRAFT_1111891 [Russula brevipes]
MPLKDGEEDNIIAALEHRDQVHRISLWCVLIPGLVAAMQEPFPELTDLEIITGTGTEGPVILLDSFLGGSAPRLRTLRLQGVRGPALQRLLLSAHDLTKLYITVPQDSVLSVSPRTLPSTRTILPSLSVFKFEGNNEYLGDFVARIDAPLLDYIKIVFDQLHFDTLQLLLFIGRTERSKLLVQAEVAVYDDRIGLTAYPHTRSSYSDVLVVEITCTRGDLDDDHDAQLSWLKTMEISHCTGGCEGGSLLQRAATIARTLNSDDPRPFW